MHNSMRGFPNATMPMTRASCGKELSDEKMITIIRNLQMVYGNSLGYREMADRIKDDYGIALGKKNVRNLMNEV